MPIYEYRCKKCNRDFEKLVYREEKITCPACGSSEVAKKFSAFAMRGVEKSSSNSACASCSSSSCSTCR
ncbi:MAG: zinc ribbon domain-containing protein [Nitrospirae bacterium]|nr:MAG: zinc ribbon domain-containing protein [Nitrospirota bacterium]